MSEFWKTEFVDFNIALYFRILNANMYGGAGSEGYASISYTHCENLANMSTDIVDDQRKALAESLGVTVDDVIPISWQEYEDNAEDDE